ncbi:conserved Plasmodium membrane protein, unknown function [Plasmodium reichenowi]|uniref:Protein ARV n=1 Tax=Plasmodium reichenowi TaxID=5854 RepID=A0A2P9DF80_PLARE|nr:conserved Plasmodium membrane protein, unknown function [Plasmodium reichenowi]
MICIKCGSSNSSLYTVYNKNNIRLNECNRCNKICDEYVEKNRFIIFLNILFLKPEIYRHIVFNRIKYHDKFINNFFLKMIIIFLIINAYLHPNFERENIKNTGILSNIFFMENNFDEYIQGTDKYKNDCSSYTLFIYKYNDKHKLYGLYNIFNNYNMSNLVNIHKNKYLTCIVNNKFSDYNLCIVNRQFKVEQDYDKELIDIFINNNGKYIKKYNTTLPTNSKLHNDHINKNNINNDNNNNNINNDNNNNINNDNNNNNNNNNNNINNDNIYTSSYKDNRNNKTIWYETNFFKKIAGSQILYYILHFINKSISKIKYILKYDSIFYFKKNKTLLKNNIITLKNPEEYNDLFQIINILVYYNIHDYKIVLEPKEKENLNIDFIFKFIKNIFFYNQFIQKKNYIQSQTNTYRNDPKKKNDLQNNCVHQSEISTFNNFTSTNNHIKNQDNNKKMCHNNNDNFHNILYPFDDLCNEFLKNINSTLNKKMAEITKKQNKIQDTFQIKQISMYSKLLFSELDNEKYILKICNSTFSFKKFKTVIISYITYFLFLCIFTYFFKLYQQHKYNIKITMVKYNYLFMLFVLSNYPLVIYFILKIFNYNYINIYLNIYTIICNIIAYHIFISTDQNYICYSIFSVLTSYLLKNLVMLKIINYI